MGILEYFELKRKYNDLLTKYDIIDDLPSILEKRTSLHQENDKLSQEIRQKIALLGAYQSLEVLKDAVSLKEEELTALETRIEHLKSILGNLESLEKVREEIATLEDRKKLLQGKNIRKYDPSKIFYFIYSGLSPDEEVDCPRKLGAFIYQGDVEYVSDDETYKCSEYKSVGGSICLAVSNYDDVVCESTKRVYNARWYSFVSLEEVCLTIGSELYLEKEVTYDEIMQVMSIFNNYDLDELDLEEIVHELCEKQRELRREIAK